MVIVVGYSCSYEVDGTEIVRKVRVSSKKALTKLKHLYWHGEGTEIKLSDS